MKYICTATLFFLLAFSINYGNAQNVRLTGTILAPTGDSVFLQYSTRTEKGFETIVLASDALDENGVFELKAKLDSARSVMLYDGREVVSLYLMPGDDMTMMLHTAYFDETVRFYGKGAARNNALVGLFLADEMNGRSIAAMGANVDTTTLFKRIDGNTEALMTVISDYTSAFPELSQPLDELQKQIELAAKQQKSGAVRVRKFTKLKEELIGKELLDIVGVDLEGKDLALSDFKGKTTVVDFWATWCGPCKAEMPHLKTLEEKYGNEVNFVSVGTWCEEEGWKTMATDLGFEHNMFVSKEKVDQLKQYMVDYIPRYMVIDKDLKIVSIDAPRPSSGELEKLF